MLKRFSPTLRAGKNAGKGFVLMEDSYTSSELSSRPEDGEVIKKSFEEYLARKQPADKLSNGVGANPPEEPDYEELFVRDAERRVRDEELTALASLAVIRSGSDERSRMLADFGTENSSHSKKPEETLAQIIRELES